MGGYFSSIFQSYVTHQLTCLLKHSIANRLDDPVLFHSSTTVGVNRLERFEKILAIVREKAMSESWEDRVLEISKEDHFEIIICKVMDCMLTFDIYHLLTVL